MSNPTCSVEGCAGAVFARGWCTRHYTRWQRHGDPLAVTRTPPMPPGADEKFCPRCANKKPLGEFGRRPNGKPTGYCLACQKLYDVAYSNTERGREARRQASYKWSNDNHEYFLQYRYGLSLRKYVAILEAQGGCCAICGTDKPGGRDTVWNVDHCHNSNKVRGLLCGPCNRGLGQFRDDVVRLRAAAAYLERHA